MASCCGCRSTLGKRRCTHSGWRGRSDMCKAILITCCPCLGALTIIIACCAACRTPHVVVLFTLGHTVVGGCRKSCWHGTKSTQPWQLWLRMRRLTACVRTWTRARPQAKQEVPATTRCQAWPIVDVRLPSAQHRGFCHVESGNQEHIAPRVACNYASTRMAPHSASRSMSALLYPSAVITSLVCSANRGALCPRSWCVADVRI